MNDFLHFIISDVIKFNINYFKFSTALWISWRMCRICEVADLPLYRKPNCCDEVDWIYVWICDMIWLSVQHSKTLETKGQKWYWSIIRYFFSRPFFGNEIILESFHSYGSLPMDKFLLNRSHNDEQIVDAQFLRNLTGILFGPIAIHGKPLQVLE